MEELSRNSERHIWELSKNYSGIAGELLRNWLVPVNDLTRTRWITEDSYFSDYLFDTRPFLLVPHRLISKRKSGLVHANQADFPAHPCPNQN